MALTSAQEQRVLEIATRENRHFVEEIQEAVKSYLEEQFDIDFESLVQRVLEILEERGIDTSRGHVRVIAGKSVLETLGEIYETVEVPIGGRNNQYSTSELILPPKTRSRTETAEVPLQGGDVEDPDMIEVQVPHLGTLPLDPLAEILEDATRTNCDYLDGEHDESSSTDVPPGGHPWYQ